MSEDTPHTQNPAPDLVVSPDERIVLLAQPRGFCAGVERAINIVEQTLKVYGAPIYVRHEIVHNKYVVDKLSAKGIIFIENLSDVPSGATLVFSAHGVSQQVRREAQKRSFRVFDATCPLVTKVHVEVLKMHKAGLDVVMIGHHGHPEVEGTMGQVNSGIYLVESVEEVEQLVVKNPQTLGYVTQTTLSVDDTKKVVDALHRRFPGIHAPKKGDICYATQNRQDAIKFMAPQCDLVIVVGSPASSNSNRLLEVALTMGLEAYLIDRASDINPAWVVNKRRVGVTAGASAPEVLVDEIIAHLKTLGIGRVHALPGIEETIQFPMPRGLSRRLNIVPSVESPS